jgi:invasion protein IalB
VTSVLVKKYRAATDAGSFHGCALDGPPQPQPPPPPAASGDSDGYQAWAVTPLAEAEAVCNIARGAAATKSDGDGAALSSSLTGAAAPDVAYYEGSMPLILAIPLGGSVLPKAAADGKMALPAGLEPDAGVQGLVDAVRVRWRELLCMCL